MLYQMWSRYGFLTYDLARKAKHVTAIDVSPKNIESAKKFFNRENINYH